MKLFCFSALLTLSAITACAQPVIGAKSGVISYIEGKVFLADKPLEMQVTQFPDVKENVTLRTEEGRAEVLLTPGVVLRMGENSSFKMVTNRLIDTRIDLLTGSAVVAVLEIAKDTNVTFLVKESSVTLTKAGAYHFDVEPARLKVFSGSADVKLAGETVTVAGGKMMTLSSALAIAEKFDVKNTDSLDHWSRRRDELMAQSNISSANQARKSGLSMDPCYSAASRTNPTFGHYLGSWGYNPYYGLATYIPCSGSLYSPYGYRYWSPLAVYRQYFAPRPVYQPPANGGYGGNPGYSTMGATSGGYSGVIASSGSSSSGAAPAAAASSGSSAASSAGSSSAGQGSGGGGGRGP